jgi:Na+-driven multidrug efflux pump
MLFPRAFVSVFTPDAALIEFAAKALRVYFSGMILFGIQIACQMTFVSLGKAAASVTVAVVRKFVLLLPLIYIMPRILSDSTMAVYVAEPVADILAVTFTAILFFFTFRKAIRRIESNAP